MWGTRWEPFSHAGELESTACFHRRGLGWDWEELTFCGTGQAGQPQLMNCCFLPLFGGILEVLPGLTDADFSARPTLGPHSLYLAWLLKLPPPTQGPGYLPLPWAGACPLGVKL